MTLNQTSTPDPRPECVGCPYAERRAAKDIYAFEGDVFVSMREGVFAVRGQPIRLTKLELAVMAVLARSAGRTVGKDLLMMAQDAIAPVGRDVEVKIIDVYICKIRRKLLAAGTPLRIQTHWGHGWKLMLDENEHAPSVAPTTLDPHALPVQANMVPLPSGPH